jgi:prolyl oligopeptidase
VPRRAALLAERTGLGKGVCAAKAKAPRRRSGLGLHAADRSLKLIFDMHPFELLRIPMRSFLLCAAVSVLLAGCAIAPPPPPAIEAPSPAKPAAIAYPQTKTVDQVDEIHGVKIADPYRWLEQDVRNSPEVAAWVAAQSQITRAYLDALPGRAAIEARLKAMWDFDKFGVPDAAKGRYFYRIQTGLQNQAVLYVQDGLSEAPRKLIDPNAWSKDGATALDDTAPSPDGKLLAYSVQDGGSDWRVIRVIDVASGQQVGGDVKWAKFTSVTWAKDSKSFFYSRYPEPPQAEKFTALNFNQAVYRHRIGTQQSADVKIYDRPQAPKQGFSTQVTDDGRWIVIVVWEGTDERYEVVVIDQRAKHPKPRTIITGFKNDYALVGQDSRGRMLFRTDLDAPRGRIVAIDPRAKTFKPVEIVAQDKSVLSGASRIGDVVIASYMVDAKTEVRRFSLTGAPLGLVALPGIGAADGFQGQAGNPETFFSFASFNTPTTIYRYDSAKNAVSLFRQPKAPFDPASIAVEQVFYTSKDGTRVPMFLVHRKDVTPNGQRPTLLYAYGGFNLSQPPSFSIARLQWVEMGGVFALANVRGGNEYGKDWHNGGRLLNKQNVFDDFIAAAEYLNTSGWTAPAHLAIQGRSNGGLLIGAVLNQRPDLFAAALPEVGVMDMMRYTQFSAGRFWTDDYGDPADPTYTAFLKGYSPLHNVKAGVDYPAILVTTADTDDRVVPGHSFKYAAAIQAAQGGSFPVGGKPRLIRIETRAGHGTGKPTDKIIAESADRWAFLAAHTGLAAPKAP